MRVQTPSLVLVLSLGLALPLATATTPAWWTSRGAIDDNPPADHAVVTQGQLKHFTAKAVAELNAQVSGGAGTTLDALVGGWAAEYSGGSHSAENPLPADYTAMNVGQLKWIADKLYARLVHLKYIDVSEVPAWLGEHADDASLANLGQLKTVFNFDLSAPPGVLPDWWQKFYFGDVGVDLDGNGDGDWVTNYEEYLAGTNPLEEDSDGDGTLDGGEDTDLDGMADRWEILHFGSITERDGTTSTDGDWLTDLEEFLLRLDPHFNDDADMDGWIDGDESKWLVPDESNVTKLPSQVMPWGDDDGDGLANALESALGTGPFSPGQPEDPALAPAIRLSAVNYDGSGGNGRWENEGRLGGEFASGTAKPLAGTKASKAAVEFQSGQLDSMAGPRVPSWLNGAGSRTVAAWVFNPAGGGTDDDVLVSWGDSLAGAQTRLFSCRYGPGTSGALKTGGGGEWNQGWGTYAPTVGTWSFVIYRYESKSGALISIRDFEAGQLNYGSYLQTATFAGGGQPNAFVLGGDNNGSGGRTASTDTSLCIGDLWVWDRSVPLQEIISEAYEPLRASYGKATALADADGDGLPDVLEVSLGMNSANANSDGDGAATAGGDDGEEFENGTNPLDFHNGRPHSVTISSGNHQVIYEGQESAPITFKVTDFEGEPLEGAPLDVSILPAVAPAVEAPGEIRLNAPGSPLGSSITPLPTTNEDGEVSILFKAD